MGVRQLAFLNEADLRRRRFFVASADQHSKISARAPRNGNAATLRTHQVGSRHVRCATPGASPAPKVCGSSGNFREDVTIAFIVRTAWLGDLLLRQQQVRLGRVPWLGVHARPADGWAGRRFPQRHRHLPLYDFMFDHFHGVVVSDLLTVEGV